MGCGASSAAGDRAIVAATKINPAAESSSSVKTPQTERTPADSISSTLVNGDKPQDPSLKQEDASKPDVASAINSAGPANAPLAELRVKSEDKRTENGVGTLEPAAKEATQKSVESKDPNDKAHEPGSAPEGAEDQAASEDVSTPTGDQLLTKRQSQNKLPPLKSPLAAVDSSKDPFAKPVLPTAVPLPSVAPVASSPTGSVTAAADSPGSNTPGSVASTPKPADSSAPGTPVSAQAGESKSPGPSKLGQGGNGSVAGTDALSDSAEAKLAHTPRTATETALTELMDDVSAVHV